MIRDEQGATAHGDTVTILVIGGTRFIGPRVVQRLAALGHRVAVFHRGEHRCALPRTVREILDPCGGAPVLRYPSQVLALQPDVVIHMMAMGEADAAAARDAFVGVSRRIVMVSSGDVYRAYGCFHQTEPGPLEPTPLKETAARRTVLYPYRKPDMPREQIEYFYDKILAEREIAGDPALPATILRLPKVYGADDNADLATVYGFRNHPAWRWTHGHVDNVALAIVLAATHDSAHGVFNVGEQHTPTMGERLAYLPERADVLLFPSEGRFEQNIDYDTSRIRNELGFEEVIPEREGMAMVVQQFLEKHVR